jgi:AcrR family transcriptional regulator
MKHKQIRQQPQQARSRATVTAIMEAMTRILDQEGFDAATTTRVAEMAGTSVGTLYQYFSDRDAILDALQDREFDRALALIQKVLATGKRVSGRTVARNVIRGLLTQYSAAPGLHRVLAIEGLRVATTERVRAFDMRVVSIIRNFLSMSGLPIRRAKVDAAAFVIFQSVRASMLARMLEAPPGLDDETLTDELTDLIFRYVEEDQVSARQEPMGLPRSRSRRRSRGQSGQRG